MDALSFIDLNNQAQALLATRDTEGLEFLFRDELNASFCFLEDRLDYSFILSSDDKKPTIYFGSDSGMNEKPIIMHRMIEILHLIKIVSRTKAGRTIWNMNDAGLPCQISFCGSSKSVLIPDCDFIKSRGYQTERAFFANQPSWADRSDVPFWRGSSTGHREGATILDTPRVRLCQLGRSLGYDFAISRIVQADGQDKMLHEAGIIGDFRPWQDHSQYRFGIDIDGNTSAWSSLFLKLLAGNVVLKVASPHGFCQWYYDRLVPWVHFAPVQSDLSDLAEVIDILKKRPDLAQIIATSGRAQALSMTFDSEIELAVEAIMSRAVSFP